MSQLPEGAEHQVELIVALNRFSDRMDALSKTGTHQTVTLSGGSFGVWVAAFSAFVCFLMMVVMLALFINHDRKLDRLEDYISAIYMAAPHLKPEEPK